MHDDVPDAQGKLPVYSWNEAGHHVDSIISFFSILAIQVEGIKGRVTDELMTSVHQN